MSKHTFCSVETICNKVLSYYPDAEIRIIQKAYKFAEEAHFGQIRSSGDPYITHPASVAEILTDLHLDIPTIVTGILHDTVEDTSVTLQTIEEEFGSHIAQLVDGVTKLSKIVFKTSEEKQAENFRKMILAMAKDIRVIFVKLADRLSNMRTLQYLSPMKQKIVAQETLEIYAPISNRLGISSIKTELEDYCFRYLHSEIYYQMAEKIAQTKKQREKHIDEIRFFLSEKLKEHHIEAEVSGRAKHFYSIFKKMEHRNVSFEQIFDLTAFRIIVDDISNCYKTLGVIHSIHKPIPGRFKDYIAMPKSNNYQSLHTTVIGNQGERVEIQIRTQKMHQIAETGIAAHWKYKEGKFENYSVENVEWVQRLLEWNKELSDPNEFLETVKIDLFSEDIFVFTPLGEVKKLCYDATPLDFAYAVHTDVGHHCIGAKVNEKMVSLKHCLKSGDTVEILTSSSKFPTKDSLNFVKSSRARTKIRSYINEIERKNSLQIGKDFLEKSLKEIGFSFSKLEKSGELLNRAKELNFKTESDLYISIGYGKLLVSDFVQRWIKKEDLNETCSQKKKRNDKKQNEKLDLVTVQSLSNILIRLGRCCHPLPGDSIVGFITRGCGVTVHTACCAKAFNGDQERRIEVQWISGPLQKSKQEVRILTVFNYNPSILATVSHAITVCGVNIVSARLRTTQDQKAFLSFNIMVLDIFQLQKVINSIEKQKGVIRVERIFS